MRLDDPDAGGLSHFADVQEVADPKQIVQKRTLSHVCIPDHNELDVAVKVLPELPLHLIHALLALSGLALEEGEEGFSVDVVLGMLLSGGFLLLLLLFAGPPLVGFFVFLGLHFALNGLGQRRCHLEQLVEAQVVLDQLGWRWQLL